MESRSRNCPQNILWKEALLVLSGSNHGSSKTGGVRKTLFEDSDMENDSSLDLLTQAVLRCAVRDSPFCLWRLASKTEAGKEFLQSVEQVISMLPRPFQGQFRLESAAASSSTLMDDSANSSGQAMEELMTPTKRILLSSGFEPAIRKQNSRAANNRERLRDVFSVLFLEPDKVKVKCNDLLDLVDAENEQFFCECLLDVYLRFCNKVAEHERSMIEKKTLNVASSLQDLELVKSVAEQLLEKNLNRWQLMCDILVNKVETLRTETCDLFVLVIELLHVAQLLGIVSFLPVGRTKCQFWSLPHALFHMSEEVKEKLVPFSFFFFFSPPSSFLSQLLSQIEDARQVVLMLFVLDKFLEQAPVHLVESLSKSASRVVKIVKQLRNGVSTMSNMAEVKRKGVFCLSKCVSFLFFRLLS